MDAQERIVKAINHEEPDRVPSFEDTIDNYRICEYYGEKYFLDNVERINKIFYYLSFGSTKLMTKLMRKFADGKLAAQRLVNRVGNLYRKIGIDLNHAVLTTFPIEFNKTGIVSECGHIFQYKRNPTYGITMTYYVGGIFENFEDYENFPKPDPDRPVREKVFKAAKQYDVEHKGEIYHAPAIPGVMESTWEGFGMENFSKLLIRPKEIKKIFDDRGKFVVEMAKRVIEWGENGVIMILDDYGYKAGLLMSPKNYKTYVFPWLERFCKTAHKGGLKVILHTCGDVSKIFEDIIKCGVDAIQPIEPTTANPEYDIFKLNEKYGDKITFVGNVSPQDLADKDPEFIKAYTKKLIKEIAPGGGYILSSGHSINPAVKLENFLAMRKTLEKYGVYPINID